jgi:hypothetical protein
MSDGDWRASIRWVVAHPTEPRVLLDRRGGGLALPAAERPGRVWTGDPAELLPSLHELLGADAGCCAASRRTRTRRRGGSGRPSWPCPGRPRPRRRGWPGWAAASWPPPLPEGTATPPSPPGSPGSWRTGTPGTATGRGPPAAGSTRPRPGWRPRWSASAGPSPARCAIERLLRAGCHDRRLERLAGHAVPPSLVHGDLHLANVARGPRGCRFFDWTDACVAHPFLDLATIRRGTSYAGEEVEAELRLRLRDATWPSGRRSSRPTGWPAPGSWRSRSAPCTRRSATARSWPGSSRRSTGTWPGRPPGGCAGSWPTCPPDRLS